MAGTARQAATVEERRVADQRQRVRQIKAQHKEVRESEYDEYNVTIQETGETKVLTRSQVEAQLKYPAASGGHGRADVARSSGGSLRA